MQVLGKYQRWLSTTFHKFFTTHQSFGETPEEEGFEEHRRLHASEFPDSWV
jgi:hypothetical protein